MKALETTKKELDRSSTKKCAAVILLEDNFVFFHLSSKPYSQNLFVKCV